MKERHFILHIRSKLVVDRISAFQTLVCSKDLLSPRFPLNAFAGTLVSLEETGLTTRNHTTIRKIKSLIAT